MENKELKLLAFKALNGFDAIKPIMEVTVESIEVTAINNDDEEIKFEPIKAIEEAVKQFANIALENIELKNQLQAKDKALEKACSWLDEMECNIIDVGAWDKKIESKEDWKEWCENGID